MHDGSDAVADWPLLNALLNTASGATWVSIHHGGGVGMGYSQHAGVVIVCDGTPAAAKRIERVLWNDPGTGVMRHADAGYDEAIECAREQGLKSAVPRLTGRRARRRMTTLWRNVHIATCDEQARVYEPGAVITDGGASPGSARSANCRAGMRAERTVDLAGRWLTPGLVDCHTHLVYRRPARRRVRPAHLRCELRRHRPRGRRHPLDGARDARRERGRAARGEPVASRIAAGRRRHDGRDQVRLRPHARRRGADAARRAKCSEPISRSTVSTSFLGAHALPPEFAGRADEYIDTMARDWLPALVREGLVDAVDAFCEDIAFTAEQCERLFAAATALGLRVRLHAEQLANIGGSRMAATHRALSCDHLEYTSDADVAALAPPAPWPCCCPSPTTRWPKRSAPPIEPCAVMGVPIAVATDCNPGSAPGASLLLAMNMARRLFGLTGAEVLLGMTRHAARALAMDNARGTIVAGRTPTSRCGRSSRSTSWATGSASIRAAWS